MRYRTVSLYDLMSLEHEIGKSEIKKILSDFSCPLNEDVEFITFVMKSEGESSEINQLNDAVSILSVLSQLS